MFFLRDGIGRLPRFSPQPTLKREKIQPLPWARITVANLYLLLGEYFAQKAKAAVDLSKTKEYKRK
jgi:hypothetical protein